MPGLRFPLANRCRKAFEQNRKRQEKCFSRRVNVCESRHHYYFN